jgi:hypothetical protein
MGALQEENHSMSQSQTKKEPGMTRLFCNRRDDVQADYLAVVSAPS